MTAQRYLWVSLLALLSWGCGGAASSSDPGGPQATRARAADSRATATVANVSIDLTSGWNAVAFQCRRLSALSGAGVAVLAWWNGTAYVTGPFTTAEVNAAGASRAFWLFAPSATTFTYSGDDGGQGGPVDLGAGWNLASFADDADFPTSALSTASGAPLGSVLLDPLSELAPDGSQRPVPLSGGTLRAGRAYWVFAAAPVRLNRAVSPAPSPSPSTPELAIVALEITPTDARITLHQTVQFTLTARLADGTTRDVTSLAQWSSSEPSAAALLSPGLYKGLNPFPATVTASLNGQSAQTGVLVISQVTPGPLAPVSSPSPQPRIYVTEYTGNRVVRMDDMNGANNVSQTLAGSGTAFNLPASICVDGTQRIYVAEVLGNRVVQMDDMSGANNVSQTLAASGTAFGAPSGVFVDDANRIYVADRNNSRIVRMDDISGANNVSQTLAASGTPFVEPIGIFVDGLSRIYVVDFGNGRIVRMDDMTGANNVSQDLAGSGTAFANPSGLFVDGLSRIYVADSGNGRIVRMDDMNGASNVTQDLAGSGTAFVNPFGLFVDGLSCIFVTDGGNGRIVRMDDMSGANNVSQDLAGSGTALQTPFGIFVR